MSNVYRLPDPEQATVEACEWLARLDRGLTEAEDIALQEWLVTSPEHAKALSEAAGLWAKMGSLSRLAHLFPKPVVHGPWHARRMLRLAASVVIALSVGLFTITHLSVERPVAALHALDNTPAVPLAPSPYRARFQTTIGERSTIPLPDGSELMLNTGSLANVEFGIDSRYISLEKGELYIKVAHDDAHPLTVRASDKLVHAIGTQFNVKIEQEQTVEVIVTEGKVQIGVMPRQASGTALARAAGNGKRVVAGQRVLLDQQSQTVQDVSSEEILAKLSWREGTIIFRGESLGEALGEIERYAPVEFVIQDESLKSIRVAGLFKAGDVDGLLATLKQNFNISYERSDASRITLKSND